MIQAPRHCSCCLLIYGMSSTYYTDQWNQHTGEIPTKNQFDMNLQQKEFDTVVIKLWPFTTFIIYTRKWKFMPTFEGKYTIIQIHFYHFIYIYAQGLTNERI